MMFFANDLPKGYFSLYGRLGCNSAARASYNKVVRTYLVDDRICTAFVFNGYDGKRGYDGKHPNSTGGFLLRIAGTYLESSDIKCIYRAYLKQQGWTGDFGSLYSPSYNTSQWDDAQEVI